MIDVTIPRSPLFLHLQVLHQLLLAGGDVFARVEGGHGQQQQRNSSSGSSGGGEEAEEAAELRMGDRLIHVAIRWGEGATAATAGAEVFF